MATTSEQQTRKQEKEAESLHKAIRILEGRIQQLERHNRSLDALVRRVLNESQRATQVAQQANTEIARLGNMLSRRN